MAGLQTVWSIDVGKSSLKAVKVQRERNHLEIVAVDKVNYAAESNGTESMLGAKEAIRTFAGRHVINCPVIVSHPGHSAFSRFIRLPPVDQKKLVEMVGYEAQQQIPFPIGEVRWDYHVCRNNDAGTEQEVGIFAVRTEVINDFMMDYETAGIPIEMISVGYLGLLNYVNYDVRPTKPSVVIDIGSDHTDLLIVDGHRFWVRNLAIAGNDVTNALMEKFKISFTEAEKLKVSASKSDQAVKIFGVVQPTLRDLVNEIHRSVGFYKSQAGDVKFEDVYIFGNSSRLVGIQKYLQEHLRFQVHLEKGFHRIRVNRDSNVALLQQDFPSFAPAVGHAIQALGEGECNINLLPRERQEAIAFRGKQKLVLAAVAATYLLLPWFWFHDQRRIEVATERLQAAGISDDLLENEKVIQSHREKSGEHAARAERLLAPGLNRLEPCHALRDIAAAWNELPNAVALEETVNAGQESTARAALEYEQEERNKEKIWLTSVHMRTVGLNPEGIEHDPKREREKRTPTIPGYACQLNGVCYQRPEGDQASTAYIEAKIVAALEQRLGERLGARPAGRWVHIEPAGSPRLIYTDPKLGSDHGSGPDNEASQGTLFEFELHWFQFQGALPVRPTEEASADTAKERLKK